MNFFHFESEENRQQLLTRARNVALQAIQQFDIEWEHIRFIQLSATITFKIETSSAGSYLLRIHSDRLTKEKIQSELLYLKELGKSREIIVSEGIPSRDGLYVLEGVAEEGYSRPYVTMMRWIEGEHLSGRSNESQVYSMGVMMGKLHEASARLTMPDFFVRPHWGTASFEQDVTKLTRFYSRFISESSWELYQRAIAKIVHQIDGMSHTDQVYGLIHGDLHSGNVIFHQEVPYPIDFGRCGYGHYLYDLAAAMLEMNPERRLLYIQGYESIRPLGKDYVRDLECFFIKIMIENYCHHSSNPHEIPGLIDEQKYAQAYLKEYVEDRSFLFKTISFS